MALLGKHSPENMLRYLCHVSGCSHHHYACGWKVTWCCLPDKVICNVKYHEVLLVYLDCLPTWFSRNKLLPSGLHQTQCIFKGSLRNTTCYDIHYIMTAGCRLQSVTFKHEFSGTPNVSTRVSTIFPKVLSFQKLWGVSGSPCTIKYDLGSIFVLNIGYRAERNLHSPYTEKITQQWLT